MDEEELEQYLKDIDRIEIEDRQKRLIVDCRDENGYVVSGCSYVIPAPFDA